MLNWMKDIENFIFLKDAPAPADIIFVPGNGHALPSELAAQLYHQGYAPRILPSGRYAIGTSGFAGQKSGSRRYEGEFETEWAFMRHILMENGVPEHVILREDEATYTYQNAIYSRRRTDAEKITVSRAIICCMPVHARRSRMYYETLYPDAELLVCPAPDAEITKENWLKSAEGIDTVLGEMERCGAQFHDILKDLVL